MSVYLTRPQVERLLDAFELGEESLRVDHEDDRVEIAFNYLDIHRSYRRYVTEDGKVQRWDDDTYRFVPAELAPVHDVYDGKTYLY